MTLPRRDPYLWLHLAGLATVPLWLDVCLVGLAVGEPIAPPWLELTTLGLVGTLPILWMQLRRPFYIFSIPGLAIRPDKLAIERRRLLVLQRNWVSRLLVCSGAIALLAILYWLYQLAPIASDLPFLTGKSRATGWLVCAIAFLFANLFVQVPATVLPLLLASSHRLDKVDPFETTAILKKFTVFGLRVKNILPDLTDASIDQGQALQETAMAYEAAATADATAEMTDDVPWPEPDIAAPKMSGDITLKTPADAAPKIPSPHHAIADNTIELTPSDVSAPPAFSPDSPDSVAIAPFPTIPQPADAAPANPTEITSASHWSRTSHRETIPAQELETDDSWPEGTDHLIAAEIPLDHSDIAMDSSAQVPNFHTKLEPDPDDDEAVETIASLPEVVVETKDESSPHQGESAAREALRPLQSSRHQEP